MNEIKTGDVFQLGEHRLVCGDSGDEEIVKKAVGGGFGENDFDGSSVRSGIRRKGRFL